MKTVPSEIYSSDYYLQRCGGIEFFNQYKADVLKPSIQLAVLRAELKPGMKILDVGCGRGELIAHLSSRGYDGLGIDYSKEAIQVAKTFFPGTQFLCGDLFKSGLQSRSFDRIFFLGTIEHLYDEEIARMFHEFRGLLKPGGAVVVTTCTNSLYFKTWTYKIRRFMVDVLRRLGFPIKAPTPPRSGEDLAMHVNEQNYFSLKKHFSKKIWKVVIEPRLNPKLCLKELYGKDLPADFPLRGASPFKLWMVKMFAAIPFLNLLITRSNIVLLKVPSQ